MATTRAKFQCYSENRRAGDLREYTLYAVTDKSIPENRSFTKYTPSGKLEITVDNPAVSFEPGKSYYLDFTEAGD